MTKFFILIAVIILFINPCFGSNSFPFKINEINQNLIDIPIKLSAKDKRTSMQLRPKFTVTSVADGNLVALKEIDGKVSVNVKGGNKYKITAELDGYYSTEKIQEIAPDLDKDGLDVILDLEPQPSAILTLKAIDHISGEAVDATFKVIVTDKVYSGKTTKQSPYYRIALTKPGSYQVEVSTDVHKPKKESYSIEIADPSRNYNKEIHLEKPAHEVNLSIVDYDNLKPLQGVKVTITEQSDNQAIFDKVLADGKEYVELNPAKRYLALIECKGYVTQKIDLRSSGSGYLIKMLQESYYSLGAFDRVTGKRLAATFKISFKTNPPIVIVGTTESDVKFNPTEKGMYEVEISCQNYVTKKIPLNLENLGAGKLNFKEVLEKSSEEYIILVVDADDKQIITNSSVKIFDSNNQPVEAKLNAKTGEWKVALEKEKDYTIQIQANGYQSQASTLRRGSSKVIGINLKKTAAQTIAFSTIDGITKKLLPAQYKVIRPGQNTLSGSSDSTKSFQAEVASDKPYSVEVVTDGYKSFSYENSETVKVHSKIFEVKKDSYPFYFKVLDSQMKQVIAEAKLRVIDLNTNKTIELVSNKPGFSAKLIPENNYMVEAEAEGYKKSTLTINAKESTSRSLFTQEIILTKAPIEPYRLTVVDEETNQNVPNANVRVFNTANEPIMISANPSMFEWLAELKNELSYYVEVKTDGYLAYRNTVAKNVNNKNIIIKIRKVPTQEVAIATVDFYTKKAISSEFKLLSGGEAVSGTPVIQDTKFKATLVQGKNYDLEISSKDYRPYKNPINFQSVVNGVMIIELKKDAYDLNFLPLDSKTRKAVPNVKINISDSDNKPAGTKFISDTQVFQASLNPEKKYTVEVVAPDYEKYIEKVDLVNLLINSDYRREILIVKREVAKKEISVNVTDNTPPVVKKEPVAAPVVKETPPEKVPEKIVASTDFGNLEIGKAVKLSNVYFEQSNPKIKPESYPELDKLVSILKENPKIKIEILGHTDNVGDPRMNMYLSELRARAVSNYLFNKGIATTRLKYTGKGQEVPIATNDVEENRQKNRRVEFVVIEN